jgi:lipoprotein-releasing system ATP-binding protein
VTRKEDPSAGPRLVVEGVRKEYPGTDGPLAVLKGVSLALGSGESVAIVGPSGSGKSTLLNVIGSLDKPTAGSVRLDGREVTALAGAELAEYRSRCVGFVFQDHHLLPQCTAVENVMLPTLAAGRGDDAARRARDLLARVELAGRADHLPAQLSGGERQRVAIARALVNEPALLLCDEPTGNLDRRSAENIADLFVGLCRDRNVMLIFVTHNLRLAKRFSRTLLLREGALGDAAGADAEA